MSDEKFTYTVREELIGGEVCYSATFIDGNGLPQEAEISYEVYSRRHEQRQQRSIERHIERVKLTEGQVAERIQTPPEPLEASVDAIVSYQAALATLTDTQRRRFLLHYHRRHQRRLYGAGSRDSGSRYSHNDHRRPHAHTESRPAAPA